MDEVGLASLELAGGHVPILHDELVGDVELVKNDVEDVDVVSRGFSLGVDELEGAEVPVADDDQRVLLAVAKGIGGREGRYDGKEAG